MSKNTSKPTARALKLAAARKVARNDKIAFYGVSTCAVVGAVGITSLVVAGTIKGGAALWALAA